MMGALLGFTGEVCEKIKDDILNLETLRFGEHLFVVKLILLQNII